jgi:hypothetical protein
VIDVIELVALALDVFCDFCIPDDILLRVRRSSPSRAEFLADVTFFPSITIEDTGGGSGGGGEDFFENSTRNLFVVAVVVVVVCGRTFGCRSIDGRVIKSGLDEVIETGSEADESDEPGRL